MITSKQRAFLRSMANTIDTILIVGKGGVSKEIIKQAYDALLARELIKGKVLETSEDDVKKVAQIIASETNSDIVQVIGMKFVLYKKSKKDNHIECPRNVK